MNFIYNPPFIIKKLFSDFYWTTSNNKILLTFDDGPTNEASELILNTLNELNIKALFFCVGENISNRIELAKEILSQGHLIGNHNYSHKNALKMSYNEQLSEIKKCSEIIYDTLGIEPVYYRPPYGKFNLSTNKLLKQAKLKNVMWSLLIYDFRNDFNLVKSVVNRNLMSSSIIVLHDSVKSKDIIKESIKYIYDKASEKGHQFGEPVECLN